MTLVEQQRRRMNYHGRVQGVGFRFTCAEIAARIAVTGWVRNLPDGDVELEVQGDPQQVNAFLDAVATYFAGNIRRMTGSDASALSGESTFSIRH